MKCLSIKTKSDSFDTRTVFFPFISARVQVMEIHFYVFQWIAFNFTLNVFNINAFFHLYWMQFKVKSNAFHLKSYKNFQLWWRHKIKIFLHFLMHRDVFLKIVFLQILLSNLIHHLILKFWKNLNFWIS
jgi:hypothetical protein